MEEEKTIHEKRTIPLGKLTNEEYASVIYQILHDCQEDKVLVQSIHIQINEIELETIKIIK